MAMLDEERQPGEEVLRALPVFPLPNAVLLPGMVLPLNVFESRYLDLVDHALAHGRHIGIPLLKPGYEDDYYGRPAMEPVFGLGKLLSHQRLPDGRRFIRLEGLGRVRTVREVDAGTTFRLVQVEPLRETAPSDANGLEVLKAQLERIARALDDEDAEMVQCVLQIPDPRILVYAVTAIMPNLGLNLHAAAVEAGPQARCSDLALQQACLAAETADERIALLLQRSANICGDLTGRGRFPAAMMN
jgi:Lon protease-like protein